MKKVVIGIILVLVLALGGFFAYSRVYIPAQAAPEPSYSTTKVRTGDISITAAGVGSVLPSEKVSVGFQINGVLAEVNVKIGDQVEKGQVLARLDDTDAHLRLNQARLDLNTFYSPNAVQQAEIAVLDAKAALADAVMALEYLISSPVYYWETKLAESQAELAQLQASSTASESDLALVKKAIDKAALYLKSARADYYDAYVWEVFPYSYLNDETGEWVYTYLEPTPDEVSTARLTVSSAQLTLQDAQDYLAALKAGIDSRENQAVSYSGTNLAKLDQARLELALAEAALEKTIIKAPVSGTVTGLAASAGQAIGTTPFLTIETLDQMALRFFVEENDISLVQVGNPVVVTFEAYPDHPVEGAVTYLEPAIQVYDGSPAAAAWASLTGPLDIQLLSGMSAEVEIIAGQAEDALLVPVQALRELAPNSYAVFIVQPDGSLKMTPVTVGLKDYANAEILSGLKAGDVVSTGTVEIK